MSSQTFTRVLQQKKKEFEQDSATIKRRLGRWRMALVELGLKLRKWLDEPLKKQLVELNSRDKEISEELIGPYVAKLWIVKIGGREVIFDPIATYVVGAYGRVDVIGPAARFKLIREKDDGHWSLIDPSDPRRTEPLTKETLERILLAAIG